MNTQIFNAVIGTAGHIDHGKSTLVKALTGIHPDRLPEEQAKGITIDLGFAPMVLSNGMRVGIIDVPGHERFVKNMVAGATGIDLVLMVVAADDGVMAQTREHLQIVELLGVRDGLTVVTKKDMVEADYLELVVEDIRELERGTVLEGKPILAVSSKTGDGIAELKAQLEKILPKLARRTQDGPFRMPIQRVFAKEGFGTVVTGVPLSGHVAIGDTLDVLPPQYHGRVKGLHAYNQTIEHGQAGHSTAVNLIGPGIDKRQVERGMVAVTPAIFEATNLIAASFALLASSPWPLKHRAAVRFHAGTAEIQAKVLLLEGDVLKPGESGLLQVLLEEKTVLAPGDRFILRLQTPMLTLGGGRTLDTVAAKRKRLDAESNAELRERLESLGALEKFLRVLLIHAAEPKSVRELCAETGMLPERVQHVAARIVQNGEAVALGHGGERSGSSVPHYLSARVFKEISGKLAAEVADFIKKHPALGGIERPALKQFLEKEARELAAYFDDILTAMKQAKLVTLESNSIALPGRERKLEGELAKLAERIEGAYLAGGLAPPSRAEVEVQVKNFGGKSAAAPEIREILKFLRETGKLVDASAEATFHRSHVEEAKRKLRELFAAGTERTTSEIRQHLGMNREFAVPLVVLLDREKFTVRLGDVRRLV